MAEAEKLRIALAQVNPTVGDIEGNRAMIGDWIERARSEGAELVVFPELCLPGYPAEDLYLKHQFAEENVAALDSLAAVAPEIAVLVGFAEPVPTQVPRRPDAPYRRPVHNALALLEDGRVKAVHRKNRLPNYGVFDEVRYFEPGTEATVVQVAGVRIGLTICEDLWEPGPPGSLEAEAGARLIVNPSGSPYLRGKGHEREQMFRERARELRAPIAFCNLVGGQDELVFDGHSVVVDAAGEVVARAHQFAEDLLVWELDAGPGRIESPLPDLDEVYAALTLGLRDYARKNGFERVVLGLSGGIDSALVALLATDALGPERVTCVVMPSPHSSDETQADARAIAGNLGAELIEIPIEAAMRAYDEMLGAAGGVEGLAAENIQARIRGNLVMAISNTRGSLVLATGNKSEMSVGYATLYGDMAGGLAVIKDVPKQLVYRLVAHHNARAGAEIVPASVIERAPSAELRPGQRDEDTLPAYDVLDRVLEGYVERDASREDLIAEGLPADVVESAIGLVDRAEYKRRQAAPGIRITTKAFGRDRRLPITNRYRT
ncbi:MAG TPA: NAD+ synthase [Solirubrobacterales bacterium]|nr:NAD+ synthase [Solirubrobacterales bacterium]